jgi:hypothetical protein
MILVCLIVSSPEPIERGSINFTWSELNELISKKENKDEKALIMFSMLLT